jgi:hypothetical protein
MTERKGLLLDVILSFAGGFDFERTLSEITKAGIDCRGLVGVKKCGNGSGRLEIRHAFEFDHSGRNRTFQHRRTYLWRRRT